MNRSIRWIRDWTALAVGLAFAAGVARAGDHKFKNAQQVPVYVSQAPVVYTAQAPVAYTAQAPVAYTAQAPVAYTAQAPVAYTAQAPVAYTAQAPVSYVAQAPATYTAQAPVTYAAQAPVTYTAQAPATTGSAPAGSAPTDDTIRVSSALRNALFADLVAFYHSGESGTTRLEKIKAVRDRASEEYIDLLGGDDDADLNPREKTDLSTIVDAVVGSGPGGAGRASYPPFVAPGSAPYSYPYQGQGGVVPTGYAPVPQPAGYLIPLIPVPLRPVHPHHFKKF